MKKGILVAMFAAASCGLFAQTDTNGNTMSSSSNYSAYSAPSNIQMYLVRDYPTAVNVTWTPMNDYWRASYADMGRYTHVYYATNGDHYTVTLPVTSTWVPDEVISSAANTWGANIYDITTLKGANGTTVYQIRTLDNGVLNTHWIGEGGTTISEYWRTDDNTNVNMSSNMNNSSNMNTNQTISTDVNTSTESGDLKIKTKTEDGKTKTKIKKG